MASELKRDRRFIFRFYFALFLIFTNRQRGAKKVASHFAQLVLLPIVMHKTMHSLTGKDSVVEISYGRALWRNFLGQSPDWYKLALIIFLIVNPLVFAVAPFVAGWLLVVEFIFTLAMALKCYPLLPGGLLAIEALLIGMTSPAHVRDEIAGNLEVLLLLMFMVAGIYFMKQLLLFVFYAPAAGDPQQNAAIAGVLPGGRVPLGLSRCADGGGGSDQRRRRVLRHLSPRRLGAPGR